MSHKPLHTWEYDEDEIARPRLARLLGSQKLRAKSLRLTKVKKTFNGKALSASTGKINIYTLII